MLEIGQVNERQIFYIKVRTERNWFDELPYGNWIAFTVADLNDKELLVAAVPRCIDRLVAYTCSAGQLAAYTEDLFDEEISNRVIKVESEIDSLCNFETSSITTIHQNFSEGFWFASVVAFADQKEIDKVVCLDFTNQGVKKQLLNLILKIKHVWLPSEDEVEQPLYDSN